MELSQAHVKMDPEVVRLQLLDELISNVIELCIAAVEMKLWFFSVVGALVRFDLI
jgi:hypothetical protein